jgi:hypothetical protein
VKEHKEEKKPYEQFETDHVIMFSEAIAVCCENIMKLGSPECFMGKSRILVLKLVAHAIPVEFVKS